MLRALVALQRQPARRGLLIYAFSAVVPVRARAAAVEIAVIAHPSAPRAPLDVSILEAIFTGAKRTWPDRKPIVAFHPVHDDPLRVAFDAAVLRMNQDEVGRFWIDQRVRGGPPPPRQVPDLALMVRVVARIPGSIGYVRTSEVNETVTVLARVRDNRIVAP